MKVINNMRMMLSHLLGLFVTFVNISSSLQAIPIKIKWRKGIGYQVYRLRGWRLVLCNLSAFATILAEVTLAYRFIKSNKLSSELPTQYFVLARRLSSFFFFGVTWVMINHDLKHLGIFINRIQCNSILGYLCLSRVPIPQVRRKWRVAYGFGILSFLSIHYLTLLLHPLARKNWSLSDWTSGWIHAFSKQYFIDSLPRSVFTDIFSLSIGFMITFLSINFQFFTQWLPLLGSLLLLGLVMSGQKIAIENSLPTVSWKTFRRTTMMVVEFHELLKRVFQDFNNVFGFMALGITVICIPQLVSFFNELLNPSSPFRFIRNMVRFAHFFFYMTLTAFINSKTDILSHWISKPENYATLSSHQLNILLAEITKGSMGIYALGLFKITIETVGSIITIIFTFSIIILQFQFTGCEPEKV